jgi:hypothetical protein
LEHLAKLESTRVRVTRGKHSAIHVNRVLRQLRQRGLLTFRERRVTIRDATALKSLGGCQNPEEEVIVIQARTPSEG